MGAICIRFYRINFCFCSLWINNEKVHIILVLFAVPISLFALAKSLRIHHDYKCISFAVIGLLLLVLAIFMHNINFGGEYGHIDKGEATHHEDGGHEEATHHEEGGHGHHEHGGIGETLETIFTVIGGLVLLYAHYLNIRFTKKSI